MYNAYFGLSEKPFTIAPNPRYLFMSERHQEALAHLLYGMQGEGGVMVLTGEVGTGKTTICRSMLEQVPENTNIAYIINPKLTALELLASICDELHINYPTQHSIKDITDLLNEHLLCAHADGQNTVVIIDEAQNLDSSVLEQLRLLTNLETNDKKLLQIMLIGQPELGEMLQRNDLRQLAQRITARYHLKPLNQQEVTSYINHRLSIAGKQQQQIFSAAVMREIFKKTQGVPRLINLIADRALLGAYASESQRVNKKIVKQAHHEVCGEQEKKASSNLLWTYAGILLLVTAGFTLSNTPTINNAPATATVMKGKTVKTIPAPAELTVEKTPMPEPVQVVAQPTPPAFLTIPLTSNQDLAFKAVFSSWNIDYLPERDGHACVFAEQHQLQCLRQRGDIAYLRNLGRPAVLTLSDKDGNTAYSAITALTGTTANGANGQATSEIPLPQLALQSHNDFTLLWRAPQGYRGPVRPGHQGKLVQLLAQTCTKAQGQQWIGAPRTSYDTGLKEQVKSFQRSQGLNPDGVAGPITWIFLNNFTHTDIPSLSMVSHSQTAQRN